MVTTHEIIREMQEVDLGDERRGRRAQALVARLAQQPRGTLQAVLQGRAELVAAYRFLNNEAVSSAALLEAHTEASVERMHGSARVLCVADSSFISYGHRAPVAGLGPHNRAGDNGFFIHPTFAVSAEGLALGTVHWHSWVRDARLDKHKTQAQRPLEQKESARWLESLRACSALQARVPATRLTFLADREGDFYELLAAASVAPVDYLIRAQADRVLPDGRRLGTPPPCLAPLGTVRFTIASRAGQRAREVTQTLWAAREALSARRGHTRTAAVEATVVWAQESAPPAGVPALQWILLTNLPVTTLAAAAQLIDWYRLRWRIEQLFDALKNICLIEAAQLRSAHALRNLCALHLIVAWRLLYLQTLARDEPTLSATCIFAPVELTVLALAHAPRPPPPLLTLSDALLAIAKLGGYLARKHDKPPGLKTLARGYERLCWLAAYHHKITPTCV
jgi:hypothetical protein